MAIFFKKTFSALILTAFLILPLGLQAQSYDFSENSGLNSTSQEAGFNQEKKSPEMIVQPIITAILSLIGVLFLGLAIFGGIRWMTAQGNEKRLSEAHSILTNAVIGLIVVAAAYAISYFVLKSIAGPSLKVL